MSPVQEKTSITRKGPGARQLVEKIMNMIFLICGLASILFVVAITLYMLISGLPAIREIGLWNFLAGTVWAPTASDPSYGILPMILASVIGTLGASAIGVPVGVLTAVFICYMAPRRLLPFLTATVELLAGIPSVVFGLVGMILLSPMIARIFDLSSGATLLTAILVLAVMILPTIVSVTITSLRAVPEEYVHGSLALGGTETTTIFKMNIPAAKSGIVTGIVLGIGRAIGETMAIIMVSGNVPNMPNLVKSVRFLTTGIVSEMNYASGTHREALFSIGLVLFIFIFLINLTLNRILKKQPQ